MKKYKKQICLIANLCLLGTAAFCGYHIYDHYADEAEQTEAFENIAEIVEQAQAEDGNAPEVPLTEEENILTEYSDLDTPYIQENCDLSRTSAREKRLFLYGFELSRCCAKKKNEMVSDRIACQGQ